MRLFPFVMTLVVALAGTAGAESLFERGFQWTPKGADAALPVQNSVTVKSMVVVQLGTDHIVGLNADTGLERWRFSSKAHAIKSMGLRGENIFVEAEQLLALAPQTGEERWEFPLNCFPGRCNTSVKLVTDEFVVLTGFDGKDDNLLLLDSRTGARQWPNWVNVPSIKDVVITPAGLIVSSAAAPYAVVALDRFTSRERWKLSPEGIEGPAAGLRSDGTVVNAWWQSGAADVVLSADVTTGKTLAEWTVARRKGTTGDLRSAAPGVFVAYQPSRLSGGAVRAFDNRTGAPLWKKDLPNIAGSPLLIGDRILFQEAGSGITVSALSAATGAELWRYTRPDATSLDWRFEGGRAIAVIDGKTAFVALIDLIAGRIEGVAPIEGKRPENIRYSTGSLYFFRDKSVERLDPADGDALAARFQSLVQGGQMDQADALAKKTRPFVQELAAAAKINKVVGGTGFQSTSQKMRAGGLPSLLAALQSGSADDRVTFYDDFRVFILNASEQLEKTGPGRVDGDDLPRLSTVAQRIADLGVRFERQLAGAAGADKVAIKALITSVAILAQSLIASERLDDAYATLARVWPRSWVSHGEPLKGAMKISVASKVLPLLPALEKAVAANDGADVALSNIADLVGLEALMEQQAPTLDAIPDMTATDFASTLEAIRAVVRAAPR